MALSTILSLAAPIIGAFLGTSSQNDANETAAETVSGGDAAARADLAPYRELGLPSAGAQLGALGLVGAGPPGLESWQRMGLDRIMDPNNPFDVGNVSEGFETSPGYQFRMDEGTRALESSAAAKGGILSGEFARDMTTFGQNVASDEYWKYYGASLAGRKEDQASRGQAYSRLFNTTTLGANAAARTATNTVGTSGRAGEYQSASGGSALGSALNQFGSQLTNLLSAQQASNVGGGGQFKIWG